MRKLPSKVKNVRLTRQLLGSFRGKILAIFCLTLICLAAPAMDRWLALAMIESGEDDRAVGRDGEVSRFQIRSELWPGGDPRNAKDALVAAQKIMQPRLEEFQKNHSRAATDFEFYMLWNAPAQIDHPSSTVAERARRFSDLVQVESNDSLHHETNEIPVTDIHELLKDRR